MTRLIDADELLEDNTWEWFDDWGNYTLAGQAIADAPTVDAVEVVRCKDCRNYEETCTGYGYCYRWDYEDGSSPNQVDADDFCSRSEKDGRG